MVYKKFILIVILTGLLTAPFYRGAVQAESDPFPVYSCIQPNVDFWISPIPTTLAFILILTSEVLERYSFYQSYQREGI